MILGRLVSSSVTGFCGGTVGLELMFLEWVLLDLGWCCPTGALCSIFVYREVLYLNFVFWCHEMNAGRLRYHLKRVCLE